MSKSEEYGGGAMGREFKSQEDGEGIQITRGWGGDSSHKRMGRGFKLQEDGEGIQVTRGWGKGDSSHKTMGERGFKSQVYGGEDSSDKTFSENCITGSTH